MPHACAIFSTMAHHRPFPTPRQVRFIAAFPTFLTLLTILVCSKHLAPEKDGEYPGV